MFYHLITFNQSGFKGIFDNQNRRLSYWEFMGLFNLFLFICKTDDIQSISHKPAFLISTVQVLTQSGLSKSCTVQLQVFFTFRVPISDIWWWRRALIKRLNICTVQSKCLRPQWRSVILSHRPAHKSDSTHSESFCELHYSETQLFSGKAKHVTVKVWAETWLHENHERDQKWRQEQKKQHQTSSLRERTAAFAK